MDEYGLDGLYGVPGVNRAGTVQLEIAVHLVGGDVVQPDPVCAYRFQDREGADDVAVQERLRIRDRVVDVGLGGEVHDGVRLADQRAHQLGVGDIALHQPDTVGHRCQRLLAARVRHRIEHGHRCGECLTKGEMHEVRPDEPGAAGDQ